MPGLVPGIHAFIVVEAKTWMAGTSPAMTVVLDSRFREKDRLRRRYRFRKFRKMCSTKPAISIPENR